MAYLIDKIVKQITAHAESLHEEVEIMAKVSENNRINIVNINDTKMQFFARINVFSSAARQLAQ